MASMLRLMALLFSASLLMACTLLPDFGAPDPIPSNDIDNLPKEIPDTMTDGDTVTSPGPVADSDAPFETLPETISTQVKAELSAEIGATELSIGRYSRETWIDGCLGLGGPAELCLAALTEGWQVEVLDGGNQGYFYRTDLNGNSIRRSTLDNNLPPSLRDRIFQTIVNNGQANLEDLSVTAAEPQFWDGCYGIPPADSACPAIGVLGWRTVISDGHQTWIYHSDNGGSVIRQFQPDEDVS